MTVDRNYIIEELRDIYKSQGSFVSGDRVILPSVNVAVMPEVYQLKENVATIGYHIYSPEWKNEIFEVSSAMGADSKTAVGMAQGSFIYGIMETVQAMMNDVNPREADSDFLGLHQWKVYLGNIVAMGKEVTVDNTEIYWNILKDEILKRIGNQEICYIKIYAANSGDGKFVTGECRINDTKIDSLSQIVEEIAKTWHNKNFASHKQFFLLKQEGETLKEYPYNNADIQDAVQKAMLLYQKVTKEGKQQYYLPALAELLKDKILAQDIYNFLPEILAELSIEKVKFSESVQMNIRGHVFTFYKTQLATYYPILNASARVLDSGILQNAPALFESLLNSSASVDAIKKALDDGSKLENLMMTDIIFNVSDDYIVR